MKIQYISDSNGQKTAVVIPILAWEKIEEKLSSISFPIEEAIAADVPSKDSPFSAIKLNTQGFSFNRVEAHER